MNHIKSLKKRVVLLNVLLSIKPKYVEAILKGIKKYEFRKSIFKKKNIDKIFIYSTSPIKRVVGLFRIGNIIEDHPDCLWKKFKDYAGLTEIEFFNYFNGNSKGYAIQIKDFEIFENPKSLSDIFPDIMAPQSFCYITERKIPKEKNFFNP